jgi:hypothetical protein
MVRQARLTAARIPAKSSILAFAERRAALRVRTSRDLARAALRIYSEAKSPISRLVRSSRAPLRFDRESKRWAFEPSCVPAPLPPHCGFHSCFATLKGGGNAFFSRPALNRPSSSENALIEAVCSAIAARRREE